MENFYVVFDATNPNFNRIGLSYNVNEATKQQNNSFVIMLCLIAVAVFVLLIATTILCICMRKRRQERLAKAKTYFDSLKTGEDEEQFEENDGIQEADNGKTDSTANPNNFLKSTK